MNSFDNVQYVGLGRSTFQELDMHKTDDSRLSVMYEKDPFTEADDANVGFITQGKFTSKSKSVGMMGRLHCGMF